jgi:8-amino-7-oxononanoate synthase
MMVRAVVAPTVPRGTERVRVCLHANNTMDEVGLLIRTVREWCESKTETQKENGEALSSLRARL